AGQWKRRPEGGTGCRIPEPGRLAAFDRQEDLAVQAEASPKIPARLRKARPDEPAGGRVPELGVPLVLPPRSREGEEDVAVRAQANGNNIIRGRDLHGPPDGLSRVGIPESHGAVETAGQDGLAVGAERHGGNRTLMLQEAEELACGGVPEPCLL